MSYFGDHSPQQRLLDEVELIQEAYNLTKEETVILVLNVLQAVADPYDNKCTVIRGAPLRSARDTQGPVQEGGNDV